MFLENPFVPGVRVNVGRALPVQSCGCYPVALVYFRDISYTEGCGTVASYKSIFHLVK